MNSKFLNLMLVLFLMTGFSFAQENSADNVHLFQSFFEDANISQTIYGDAGLEYGSFTGGNTLFFGARGGYPVNPDFEVGAALGFQSFNPEVGDGNSGLSDLLVSGKYNIVPGPTKISVGGFVTLPIGSEDVGAGNLNFGAFGGLRHPLDNGIVITGTAGLEFMEFTTYETGEIDFTTGEFELEEKTEYESSLLLGGGAIYPVNNQLHAIGELIIKTKGDYMLLSGGVDYLLNQGGRIRGALGIGLDDGAPDVLLMGSYAFDL